MSELFYVSIGHQSVHDFLLSESVTGHSLTISVQHDFATPSSFLLVPPAFSPCLDANGGTDILLIGSPGCLTLQLLRTSQMWNGGSIELHVTKGYWTTVGAKLLLVVGENLCLISHIRHQLLLPICSSDLRDISVVM